MLRGFFSRTSRSLRLERVVMAGGELAQLVASRSLFARGQARGMSRMSSS